MSIAVADGMACGFWMRISAEGLFVLRGTNDAQMSVEELRITPMQFASMNRNQSWMAGVQWREVGSQRHRDDEPYWLDVMDAWSMEHGKTYETFDGMLPVSTAKRLGLIDSGKATFK